MLPRVTIRSTALLRSAITRPAAPRRAFWGRSSASSTDSPFASSSPFATGSSSGSSSSGGTSADLPSIPPDFTQIFLAIALQHSDEAPPPTDGPWTVRAAQGKGLAALASRQIQTGELLIAERPLCIWPQGLDAPTIRGLFESLSDTQKREYMALSPGVGPEKGMDELLARRGTNGFAIELPLPAGFTGPKSLGFVFPKIARVNHSCLPNASQAMNFQTLRMELYALCPISPGTEITIEYRPMLTLSSRARQVVLQSTFGITKCACDLCAGDPVELEKSDKRREEIGRAVDRLKRGGLARDKMKAELEKIRVLVEDEKFQGLPEFDDERISRAFQMYAAMQAREARENQQQQQPSA